MVIGSMGYNLYTNHLLGLYVYIYIYMFDMYTQTIYWGCIPLYINGHILGLYNLT